MTILATVFVIAVVIVALYLNRYLDTKKDKRDTKPMY